MVPGGISVDADLLPQSDVDFTVFYFTYSTIAQALAGIFGLLVAAVLYRIHKHASDILELKEDAAKQVKERLENLETPLVGLSPFPLLL